MNYALYSVHNYLCTYSILSCLALYGQVIGVDLLDDGLYFGFEGPSLRFPTQISDIAVLKQALEALYFFKVRNRIFSVYR